MAKRIQYHREKCNACGLCVMEASQIWEISTLDGKANLLDAEFKKDCYFRVLWPDEQVLMGKIEKRCPAKVICLI